MITLQVFPTDICEDVPVIVHGLDSSSCVPSPLANSTTGSYLFQCDNATFKAITFSDSKCTTPNGYFAGAVGECIAQQYLAGETIETVYLFATCEAALFAPFVGLLMVLCIFLSFQL